MGTYAQWILWVGVAEEIFSAESLNEEAKAFINELRLKPLLKNGLLIKEIGMHGRAVGIGIVIHELDWEVVIGGSNVFDPKIITQAQEAVPALNNVFKELVIPFQAVIYNHIDLGG